MDGSYTKISAKNVEQRANRTAKGELMIMCTCMHCTLHFHMQNRCKCKQINDLYWPKWRQGLRKIIFIVNRLYPRDLGAWILTIFVLAATIRNSVPGIFSPKNQMHRFYCNSWNLAPQKFKKEYLRKVQLKIRWIICNNDNHNFHSFFSLK